MNTDVAFGFSQVQRFVGSHHYLIKVKSSLFVVLRFLFFYYATNYV